jgi:hypothetical protein
LTPPDFATRDLREMLGLLILVAIAEQRGPEHPYAETIERRPATQLLHFLAQYLRFFTGKSSAAIFVPPFWHGPALCGHELQPNPLRIGAEFPFAPAPADILFATQWSAHLFGAILLEPCVSVFAEGFKIGHRNSPDSATIFFPSARNYKHFDLRPLGQALLNASVADARCHRPSGRLTGETASSNGPSLLLSNPRVNAFNEEQML